MNDNKKISTLSTSKQVESEEQDVYDVEKIVQSQLPKPISKDRLVFFEH